MLAQRIAVHHVEDGPRDGPPVVLSHPLGTDLRVWHPNVSRLAQHLRVIRYDHRGHGASPVPSGPYTIEHLGGDVLDLLDHLGITRTSFVGTSLGGMVGMWLAANAPERIDRLAVLSPSAWLGDPEVWHDRAAIVRANGTVSVAEGTAHRWVSARYVRSHPDVVARLIARFVGTADEGYAATCAALAEMDLRPDLGRISAPTLVIAGSNDAHIPLTHAETVAAAIPGARYKVFEGAGHFVALERPDEVTSLLEDHLFPVPIRAT